MTAAIETCTLWRRQGSAQDLAAVGFRVRMADAPADVRQVKQDRLVTARDHRLLDCQSS